MAWGRWKRKIAVDQEKAKGIKTLLKSCKNDRERRRVLIVSVYLWGQDIEKTSAILWVWLKAVCDILNLYIKDPEWFYKTNYKGKIETQKRKNLKEEVRAYVEKKIDNMENIDINWVLRDINKTRDEEVTTYNWMRWILRKALQYNYHKPFVTNQKQSDHAQRIIKWRLTKSILEVALEEKHIDWVSPKATKEHV